MSPAQKPENPKKMMGVYKTLEDVPERRRFHQYTASYEGRDVWSEYLRESLYSSEKADSTKKRYKRIEGEWKAHMNDRGRHHALATTEDVEKWSEALLERLSVITARWKWEGINEFYDWLLWHTEHPHLYNPFLMAAARDGPSAVIWEERLNRRGRGQ